MNPSYKEHYDLLITSGLYDDLVSAGLLIPHAEVSSDSHDGAYKILKPALIPFISYPYEWSFSQLKDAALTTLEIQKKALARGMSLKDASAYNIQFYRGRPVLIDTLSFESYREGYPWVAYRQFCQHFLGPLALMGITDVRFNQLLRLYIDGIPLDLTSKVLPLKTRCSLSLLIHIHLHAKSQKHYENRTIPKNKLAPKVSRQAMLGIVDNLRSTISGLRWKPEGTEWVDYYQDNSYTPEALEDKKQLVEQYIDKANPKTLWDLGANTGVYTRIAAEKGISTISFDIDPACVELNYREVIRRGEQNILPLILDLANPSPPIGWANEERMSIYQRGPAEMIMALALIHHIAISNNVPLSRIADLLGKSCTWLIIEFVPKSDLKVQKLLATRDDIFTEYTREAFEKDFSRVFDIQMSKQILNSERTLYLMRSK